MAASILFHGASNRSLFAIFFILQAFVNKCFCHLGKDQFPVELEEEAVLDFILCRSCGADIVDAGFIINHLSPGADVVPNNTLFDKKGVDVQFLVNPFGIKFATIVLSKANCQGASDSWTSRFTWYPGYAWKICVCRHCNRQLGWIFEPIESATADRSTPSSKGFYLMILDNLLSEKFANSLIVVPKFWRS